MFFELNSFSSQARKKMSILFSYNFLINHEWTRIDTNTEEICPRITRMDAKIHLKRKSFALIRVIRGQICLSLLFQGGTRCPARNVSHPPAAMQQLRAGSDAGGPQRVRR
jgi:hypothetical protein